MSNVSYKTINLYGLFFSFSYVFCFAISYPAMILTAKSAAYMFSETYANVRKCLY